MHELLTVGRKVVSCNCILWKRVEVRGRGSKQQGGIHAEKEVMLRILRRLDEMTSREEKEEKGGVRK